jgi:oxalate decarboxylase
MGSAALAAAGMLAGEKLTAQEQAPYQQKSNRSSSDPGPTNPALDAANPDSNSPPITDAGGVQTFKYPFSLAHKRMQEGGWSREVTQRELSISKTMAGVDMRLTAGGVRELHWHSASEWAFMTYGSARITCIDAEGKSFVTDVKENELWFFPPGIPHSIQGLAPDGCEFILVFDDGNFSEYETVLLTDWMAHTPRDVVAKNFGVSEKALSDMPKKEKFIFQTAIPGPLAEDKRVAAGALGPSPIDFAFRTLDMPPTKSNKSGDVRIIDSKNFKITTTSAAIVTVKPGGVRELHWHPNADEWQYYIQGSVRMTVFNTGPHANTTDFKAGDVGLVRRNCGHYVENTGDEDLIFIETFRSDHYEEVSLANWLSHLPPKLVSAHLNIPEETLATFPRGAQGIVPLK